MSKSKFRFSLSTQINLIFTVITLVTSVLFVMVFRRSMFFFMNDQAQKAFITFSETLSKTNRGEVVFSEYYYYIVYELDENKERVDILNEVKPDKEFIDEEGINEFYETHKLEINSREKGFIKYNRLSFYFVNKKLPSGNIDLIITVGDNTYASILREPINNVVTIGFIAIILLGNAIILLWSSITVERIKMLERGVRGLSESSYTKPVEIEGNDEITSLASTIDIMRQEISNSERVKQEMLQNLSHDIKTPISVIKSYAEAIKDGVSDPEDIEVVIKQTDILTSKVTKLLEWNRLVYVAKEEEFYPVNLNTIIKTVANNYKFKKDVRFELDLDNSYLMGLDDHYYVMISNIVENALRYAKSVIKITLKARKLTIFNDGEPIDKKFIDSEFKPYEKGHKGQFGLGLTIVQKTVNIFNLKLRVENVNGGVMFTIEPL